MHGTMWGKAREVSGAGWGTGRKEDRVQGGEKQGRTAVETSSSESVETKDECSPVASAYAPK